MIKRVFDIIVSIVAILALSVPLIGIGLAIIATTGCPALFRQIRVGRGGRGFILVKFRTMTVMAAAAKGSFDAGASRRVTAIGRLLRKTKLDELPQLWNVLKGEMSLVGPRPEVRKWVEVYPERWEKILTVPPGITDPASIAFRNEEELLAAAENPEEHYRTVILPQKLALYEQYVKNQSFCGDLKILCQTVWVVLRGSIGSAQAEERKESAE